MKAIVYEKYGPPDVLQLKEVERPALKEAEVLVKVHATSLNAYDWRLLRADPFLVRLMPGALFKPKTTIPGADIAGRVEAVGRGVNRFQPGDPVFGAVARGRYVMAGGTNAQIFQAMLLGPLMSNRGGKGLGGISAITSREDLLVLRELPEAGKIVPVIDRCFPFREAIDALRYVDAGHAKGKVVVTVEPGS